MPALELEGKLIQKLEPQKGQSSRGSWTKQAFVVEYQDGNYPANVCFSVFGDDKVAELDKYRVGDRIKVSFNLRAREYNGKWYNDINVWRFNPLTSPQEEAERRPDPGFPTVPPPPVESDGNQEDDLPF